MNSNTDGWALVTGANGGMGREICSALLAGGRRVIAACRPGARADAFFAALLREAGPGRAKFLPLDLSSFDRVSAAAAEVIAAGEPVDVLVNNAGMLGRRPEVNAQGFDLHHVVNALSPVLLARCLRPALRRGSRVINTVSCTVRIGRIAPDFPRPPERFNRIARYADSKLALLLLTLWLAREWEPDGIAVNAADPGIVDTPILTMHRWFDPLTDLFFRPLIRAPRRGASTAVFLALDASVSGVTGRLFAGGRVRELPPRLAHHPQADRVRDVLLAL